MIKNLKRALPVFVLLLAFACKNPVEDIKVVVDTNIIKYSALVHIGDAANPDVTPQNISISITGESANDIYEISGKKVFTVKDGIISLGLNPSVTPSATKTVQFNVVISAPGYQQQIKQIQFVAGQLQQVVNVSLAKVGAPVTPPVVTPTPTPTATVVALDLRGRCANNTNLEIRPSIYVFYREAGINAAYQYLGYMDKGHIETNLLTMGKTYEFKITYSGENYTITQKIDEKSYTRTIDMGSSVCNTF